MRPRAWGIKGKKATVFRNTRAINPEAKTQFKSIKPIIPSPKRNLYIQIHINDKNLPVWGRRQIQVLEFMLE